MIVLRGWQIEAQSDVARVWSEPRRFARDVLENGRTRLQWIEVVALNLAMILFASLIYVRSGALAASEGLARISGVFQPPLRTTIEYAAQDLALSFAVLAGFLGLIGSVCFLFRAPIAIKPMSAACYGILAAGVGQGLVLMPITLFHEYAYAGLNEALALAHVAFLVSALVAVCVPVFVVTDELFVQRSAMLTGSIMVLVFFTCFVIFEVISSRFSPEQTPQLHLPGLAGATL